MLLYCNVMCCDVTDDLYEKQEQNKFINYNTHFDEATHRVIYKRKKKVCDTQQVHFIVATVVYIHNIIKKLDECGIAFCCFNRKKNRFCNLRRYTCC